MTLKEYLRTQITIGKQPNLEQIYEELLNSGHKAEEIYLTINELIKENINKAIEDYNKKKNEK
jgi:hypothetical protein